MTTHTAIFEYYAGATLDAGSLLCHRTTDATVYTASATSELNAGGGVYSAVFANVAAGTYRLKLFADGEVVASRIVRFAATDGETVETTGVELDSATAAKIDSILEDTGATLPAAIAAIEGGGGGGTATLEKQEEILTAVSDVTSSVAAYAARLALEVSLTGFPSVICRNSDYVEETESEIRLTLEDLTGAAITEIAGTPVESLSWLFGMGIEKTPALIAGTCTWDETTDELVIEIPKTATAGKDTGSLTWQVGVSIGDSRRWLGGGTTRLIERQF